MPRTIYDQVKGLYQAQGEGVDLSAAVVELGPVKYSIVSATSNFTVSNESVVLCNSPLANITLTLPSASTSGRVVYIKKIDTSAFSVIVNTVSGQTIDGASSKTFSSPYAALILVSYSGSWHLLNNWWTDQP